MKFIFYSPVYFEKWDWRNSIEKGIGGSETSHVEMAWRLAARGHEVITYAPIPDDCPGEWRYTKWYPLEKANFSEQAIWVLYRCPEIVDEFIVRNNESPKWLIMQDWDYPTANSTLGINSTGSIDSQCLPNLNTEKGWNKQRVEWIDKIVPLCQSHADYLIKLHPEFEKKIWITSNGIKLDLIKETEAWILNHHGSLENYRNPKQIIYASSPDRGLLPLLKIFKRAREYDNELELNIFYGFDNISKLPRFKKLVDTIKRMTHQPGVHLKGRVSQNELYKQWFKSGIWIYCTNFWETSCITCQEAQAMGAIPIFSPIWAQAENIKHGMAIAGDSNDPLTLSRFTDALLVIANDIIGQEKIRKDMITYAREKFNWENFVTQWIEEAKKEYQLV